MLSTILSNLDAILAGLLATKVLANVIVNLTPTPKDDEIVGKVSEEVYAKAEKAGLTRQFVDSYVKGQAAIAEAQAAELYKVVGGEAAFKTMAAWASANLTANELRGLNEAFERGSMPLAKTALAGLQARYVAANGREPDLLSGTVPGGETGFRSQAEAKTAMADPRYSRDPAYRADVEAKLRVGAVFSSRTVGH